MRLSLIEGVFSVQYATLAGGPLLAAFLLALGATPAQIGFVAALPLLGGLAQPLGAEVIRRRGGWRKPVVVTAVATDLAIWPISLGAVLFLEPAAALTVMLGALVLQYAAESFTAVAWTSWISDLVPARLRGRYFGRRNFLTNLLSVGTAAGAGLVIEQATTDVIPVFCALVAVGMACRLGGLFMFRRHPEPEPAQSLPGGFLDQIWRPLEDEPFGRFVTYGTAWNLSVHLAAPFFTVYMIREAGVGADVVMLFAAIGTAANLVGQWVWGPLCDRWGDRAVLRVAGFLVALQPLWWLVTSPSASGVVLMGALCATGGFVWGGHLLAYSNLMMRLAPSLGKTAYFATQAALAGLFGALGPLVGGLLATTLPAAIAALPDVVASATLFGIELLGGLKSLFLLSTVLRLVAWGLLHRVPAPTRPRNTRLVAYLRSAVQSFNPAQGISPLLQVFSLHRDDEGKG